KPLWSGAAQGASHQHRNPNRAMMHNFDRLTEQLIHAGLAPGPPGNPTGWVVGQELIPSLEWVRPAFRDPPRFKPEFFNLYGPYMLMIPGSSAEHPEKRWPVDRFAEIASWVASVGITPVILGAKAEGDIGNQIMKLEPRARSIIGRTDLFQLATLSEKAVLAIGGDTGPMHLAAAARAPGVCLFAQEWTPAMAADLQTVWNPQTRLGRAAPRGGPMVVVHAASLDQIGVDDVKYAALGMNVLPPNISRPEPKPEPAPETGESADIPPDASSAELAQGSDS
ncbi:MAG TPA: glycosyltransferase family 9 protein, partial [Hyphomonadaceae bacterium]|nr:glycosyltransferase family 9 protein [Hyphomonadaceae bacterium]